MLKGRMEKRGGHCGALLAGRPWFSTLPPYWFIRRGTPQVHVVLQQRDLHVHQVPRPEPQHHQPPVLQHGGNDGGSCDAGSGVRLLPREEVRPSQPPAGGSTPPRSRPPVLSHPDAAARLLSLLPDGGGRARLAAGDGPMHAPLASALARLQPRLAALELRQLQVALDTLVSAHCAPADAWADDFLAASEQLLRHADAVDVYSLLASMRVLHLRPQQQWVDAATHVLEAHLPQLDPSQLVDLLTCMADLALRPQPRLLRRVEALLQPDLALIAPAAVVWLLEALARLGHVPAPHVQQAAMQALLAPTPSLEPGPAARDAAATPPVPVPVPAAAQLRAHELCSLTRSALALQLVLPLELAAALAARAYGRVRDSSQRGGVAAFAFAAAHTPAGHSPRQLMPRSGKPAAGLRPTTPAVVAAGASSATAAAAPAPGGVVSSSAALKIRPAQLAQLLLDFRALAVPAPPGWQQLVRSYTADRLYDGTGPGSLSYLLGAMTKSGVPLGDALAVDVARHLERGLRLALGAAAGGSQQQQHAWTPAALCGVLGALAPAAAHLPASLAPAVYATLFASLDAFSLPDLNASLHALPALSSAPGAPPPPPQLLALYQARLLTHMRHVQPHHVSMVLHALVRLGCRPDPFWMDALLGQALRVLPRCNEEQLANVAWAVAKLGFRCGRHLACVCMGWA